jgi:hypothetical protein
MRTEDYATLLCSVASVRPRPLQVQSWTAIFPRDKVWRIVAIAFVALLIIVAALPIVATAVFSSRLSRYVESKAFRAELEKQTAKGLHFPSGHYETIMRSGMWTAERRISGEGWKEGDAVDGTS